MIGDGEILTHTPYGDELHLAAQNLLDKLFQPTPPYGDEHLVPAYKCQAGNFNPHPPYGDEPRFA